jgi:hypothetical protein
MDTQIELPKRRGRPPKVREPAPLPADVIEILMTSAYALEIATTLRSGAMDSQSRADDVANEIKSVMTTVAANLRLICG